MQEDIPMVEHKCGANGYCTVCGATFYKRTNANGTENASGEYILFGEDPQSIKLGNVTITEPQDSRGYYLGSDGSYYAKVTGNPYESGFTFSTGASVTKGTSYYFKVEPIKWRILSQNNGKALILCESILINHRYDDNSNNYANSEIRTWLNNQFYNAAFTELQQAIIETTTVDNSARSTAFAIPFS